MFFSWLPMVMSVIYNILSHYPKVCLAYQDLFIYVLLVLIFSSQSEQRKTVLCLSLCLINKLSPGDLWVKIVENAVIIIELMKLSPLEWPQNGHGTAKWQLKKVFVVLSFKMLHRLAQLYFTRVVLDLGDSPK